MHSNSAQVEEDGLESKTLHIGRLDIKARQFVMMEETIGRYPKYVHAQNKKGAASGGEAPSS